MSLDVKPVRWGFCGLVAAALRCACIFGLQLHALLELTGIEMAENKVRALAYALFGFLRDNPTLFPGWQSL